MFLNINPVESLKDPDVNDIFKTKAKNIVLNQFELQNEFRKARNLRTETQKGFGKYY